jgi:hypothetical protein
VFSSTLLTPLHLLIDSHEILLIKLESIISTFNSITVPLFISKFYYRSRQPTSELTNAIGGLMVTRHLGRIDEWLHCSRCLSLSFIQLERRKKSLECVSQTSEFILTNKNQDHVFSDTRKRYRFGHLKSKMIHTCPPSIQDVFVLY